MLKAEQVGRDLHLTLEGVDGAFVVHPLPGRIGVQVTDTYLDGTVGNASSAEVEEALMLAADGGQWDDEKQRYVPLPEEQRTVYNRVSGELRLGEAESILLPAFFWQTVIGISGVKAYIDGGEGVAGSVKALWALVARLGVSPQKTSPSSALDTLIQLQGSTRSMSTRPTGSVPERS